MRKFQQHFKTKLFVTFQCYRNELKLKHSCQLFLIFSLEQCDFQGVGFASFLNRLRFQTFRGTHLSEIYGSILFSGHKSMLFPQGFARIQLNNEVFVECQKKMAASGALSSLETKTSLFCAIFAPVFTRQNSKQMEKSGTLQFFPSLKKIRHSCL